jgi:hypothetical protein
MTIDEITKSFTNTFSQVIFPAKNYLAPQIFLQYPQKNSQHFKMFKKTPQFKVHGGTNTENLSLQNIQVTQWFGYL